MGGLDRNNSQTPWGCGNDLRSVISKHLSQIKFMGTFCEIALMWTSQNTLDDKSNLVQNCHQPQWGTSGAHRTHVGTMLAPWNCLSGSFLIGGYGTSDISERVCSGVKCNGRLGLAQIYLLFQASLQDSTRFAVYEGHRTGAFTAQIIMQSIDVLFFKKLCVDNRDSIEECSGEMSHPQNWLPYRRIYRCNWMSSHQRSNVDTVTNRDQETIVMAFGYFINMD